MTRQEKLDGTARPGKWIDVSRPLAPGIPVWPGDVPFEMQRRHEDGMVIGSFSSTCHVGTHMDAPFHVGGSGRTVDAVPLERLIGPAEVLRASGRSARVSRDELPRGWRPRAPRILFATGSFPADAPIIDDRFRGLDVELIQYMASCGATLVGIDTPSVDPLDSRTPEAHRALAAADMIWIEGLLLDGVAPGLYHMVALPMPLAGADGAPARVALRPFEGGKGGSSAESRDEAHID